MQVEFRLARPGLMKDFAGTWRVQPFTQDAVGALLKADQPQAQNPWHSLTNTLNSCAHCLLWHFDLLHLCAVTQFSHTT